MSLRTDIEKIIASSHSETEKSIMVIVYLENAGLSLEGNGWIDDDPESKEALFGNDYGLSEKLDKILN